MRPTSAPSAVGRGFSPAVIVRIAELHLSLAQALGAALLALVVMAAILAPFLSPNPPEAPFADRAYAPPMRVHIWHEGRPRMPFVYPQVLESRLMRTFGEDRSQPVPIDWFARGRVLSIDPSHGPLLLLGADTLGRDVFARLLDGARLSLGVTMVGLAGALIVGLAAGGLAGGLGGWTESSLMLAADFVLVLPGAYLVLVLRGVLPLVLSTSEVFLLMAGLFAVAAWPHAARGVRAIVAGERARDYAEAARAVGAGRLRLVRQLLPAARGFVLVEILLLIPALLVAEATISFLGLGFPEPRASWGTQLQEAANVAVLASAPWMLAPAAAIFVVVLGVQLAAGGRMPATVLALGSGRR